MKYKSEFINEISSRGFIYQSSDIEELDQLMYKKSITPYIGFDSTSDSLHIGSLVQLMLLHWLEVYDHSFSFGFIYNETKSFECFIQNGFREIK